MRVHLICIASRLVDNLRHGHLVDLAVIIDHHQIAVGLIIVNGQREDAILPLDIVEHTPVALLLHPHVAGSIHSISIHPVLGDIRAKRTGGYGVALHAQHLHLGSLLGLLLRFRFGYLHRLHILCFRLVEGKVAFCHYLGKLILLNGISGCSLSEIELVVKREHHRCLAGCHLDGIDVMFTGIGMLHHDRGIHMVAQCCAYAVAYVEVILVGTVLEEAQILHQSFGRTRIVDTQIDGSSIGIHHSADDLHDVECLLLDVLPHAVVGREDDGGLELRLLIFLAERVDARQFHVDVEQTLYLCHYHLLVLLQSETLSHIVTQHQA